jgi:hypothetical protein
MPAIDELRREDVGRNIKPSFIEHFFDDPADDLLVVLLLCHTCHAVASIWPPFHDVLRTRW